MSPKRKLTRIFSLMLTAVSLISILLIGAMWVSFETKRSRRDSLKIREDYIAAHEATISLETNRICDYMEAQRQAAEIRFMKEIKDQVYEAHSFVNALLSAGGSLSREQGRETILNALRGMSFNGGRGRYFVSTTAGQEILNNSGATYENLDILTLNATSDYQSPAAFMEIVNSLTLVKEGFFRYNLIAGPRNQAGDDSARQIAYMKIFEPYQWLLGTSAYLEDYTQSLQEELIDWASNMPLPTDNYLMILSYDGDILAYPDARLVGRNIFTGEGESPANQKVVASMIRGAKERNKDFIRYKASGATGAAGEHIAYYRAIAPWRWVVLTWVNLNDLTAVMDERQDILARNVESQILHIVIISLSMLALVMLLSKLVSTLAVRSFSAFFSFFEEASVSSTEINPADQPFEEFARLAMAANDMIGQRVKAENEKLALQEKLSRATKMEAMGLMAAEVAHDLNNILSGIIGYPQLLLMDDNITARQKEALGEILKTGQRAAAVVSDLLTIARGVASTKVSISVNSAVSAYTGSPECKKLQEIFPKVKLTISLGENAGNIMASAVHLTKVIMNLVSNAFEAMPPDKPDGLVTIRTESIQLRERLATYDDQLEPGQYVLISVSDNGPGIPANDLGKIFEPFYSKKTKGRSGTGLGLAIVWNTIKDHRGQLDVKSSANGTSFRIYIKGTKEKTAAVALRKSLAEYRGAGQRVLVVDDVDIQRKLAVKMLKTLGYDPVALPSGEEAIDFLKKEDAALVILDMIMHPGLGGRETFEAIMEFKPGQKAIIASGMAETEEVSRAQALGAGQFVNKPYTIEDLAAAVKKALDG